MTKQDVEPSESLAAWLSEVGRRAAPAYIVSGYAPEAADDLVKYLEELAGRELRSREDIRRYVAEISAADRHANPVYKRRRFMKETALLFALAAAFIHYYFWDVNLQIARLPSMLIFVPLEARDQPHATGAQAAWRETSRPHEIALAAFGPASAA